MTSQGDSKREPRSTERLERVRGVSPRSLGPGVSAGWVGLLIALFFLTLITLWARSPTLEVAFIQNEDVAGITYNADLLLRGQVPLKDNLEYKAPGAFFLVAAVFAIFGRSVEVLEGFGLFWAWLAMLGMLVGGRVMFGLGAGVVAALLYTIGAPITDSMTVNYNSWMITPYIWATVLLVLGLKRGGLGWLIGAGIVGVLGALLKRQGATIVPLFGLILLAGRFLPAPGGWRPPSRWRGVFAYSGGVLLGFLPIVIYYLVQGGFTDFAAHYFGSGAGWEYLRGEEVGKVGKLLRLEDGILGIFEFMALPAVLALMTAAALPLSPRRGWGLLGALLGLHLLMSFVGAALGFRFYKGYYLQLLPAAAWLAAHPAGPVLRWFAPHQRLARPEQWLGRAAQIAGITLLCLPATLPTLSLLKGQRRGRVLQNGYQREVKRISELIAKNTKREERIWVWGRWAWPVYFHADRLAATRYYKVLGLITTNLTNTWNRPTSMTRFVRKGPWKEIGQHLTQRKPAFIVCANNESYKGFTPLEKLLREQYDKVAIPKVRAFKVYKHKGRPLVGVPAKRPQRGRARPVGAVRLERRMRELKAREAGGPKSPQKRPIAKPAARPAPRPISPPAKRPVGGAGGVLKSR